MQGINVKLNQELDELYVRVWVCGCVWVCFNSNSKHCFGHMKSAFFKSFVHLGYDDFWEKNSAPKIHKRPPGQNFREKFFVSDFY